MSAVAADPGWSLADAQARVAQVLAEVDRVVVGKHDELALVLAGVLARGHVLLEDLPGVGKTLAANALATALGLDFRRAQFTPDLLPSDLTGSSVFDQQRSRFEFRPGPVFTGLLLADEVNRTPPKTQAALLEAMQERQVTVDGETRSLPVPFHVIATANPIEHEGTYPLPEAQLDRFLLRLSLGYPDEGQEWQIVQHQLNRQKLARVRPVLDAAGLLAVQDAVELVHVDPLLGAYAVAVVRATRDHPSCLAGASPRGSLALVLVARAWALIQGRGFVTPADVQQVAAPALAHRITLRPELWLGDVTASDVVTEVLGTVPVPDATEVAPSGIVADVRGPVGENDGVPRRAL